MNEKRSKRGIIHAERDVKGWCEDFPDVDLVRPRQCPECGAAARPPGRALGLVGHGVRDRQVRGPLAPGEPPGIITIQLRRYRCRGCGAIFTVGPRGLATFRHYAAVAIGLALWMVGVLGLSTAEVRRRISPWQSFDAGVWVSVRRWLKAIADGRLFPGAPSRAWPPGWSLRQRAERAAMTLRATAPPWCREGGPELEVMAGAARAA